MPDPISWSYSAPYFLIALAIGYLCGSIPFGLLLTKLAGKGDVRSIGSGNIGATNVLRTGSKLLAALTLLADCLKATLPILIFLSFWGPDSARCAALGTFIGHLFPIWLRFKGGKGVATYIGILLGLFPLGALIFCLIWAGTAVSLRISSAAGLFSALAAPIASYFIENFQLTQLLIAMTILLYVKHRANISRLIQGQEPRISAGQ